MNRPVIPTHLKRRVLVEAGHRCAIPTCRHPTTEIAHITPWSKVKAHSYDNLIALCPNCHTRFDKGEIDKQSMTIYKRKLVFLYDRYTNYELNVLDYLRKNGRVVINGVLSVKNLFDDSLIQKTEAISSYSYTDGPEEDLQFVATLTDEGNRFITNWINRDSDELEY